MKIFLFLFFALPHFFISQNVNIPDPNFKAYLIRNNSINTNGDDEIQLTEASSFKDSIFCSFLDISYLTGIEEFTSLTYLDCSNNQLLSLDISKNTALTGLYCVGNQLTSLDVSTLKNLIELSCGLNELTSLDVSKNTSLTYLNCSMNLLKNIDLSKNIVLTYLECHENEFDCDVLRKKLGIK